MRRKLFYFLSAVIFLGSICSSSKLWASDVDVLLNVLVEKGVLSASEAQSIRTETYDKVAAEKQKENDTLKADITKDVGGKLPDWVSRTKFFGDFRFRYETQDTKTSSATTDASRYRIRLRYGFESQVNDYFNVGFRMATGALKIVSSNPANENNSTNQTFQNAFEKRAIWVDRAYANYTPFPWLKITGGKMANPFYTTDLVWDPDITPEGLAAVYTPKFPDSPVQPFVTLGYFPTTDNQSNAKDVSVYAGQVGITAKPFNMPVKLVVGKYVFDNIKGQDIATISPGTSYRTNTLSGTTFVYGYDVLEWGGEITPYVLNFADRTMPIKLYGDYIKNQAKDVMKDTGWLYGIKFGNVQKLGDFSFEYNLRNLDADAMPAFIPDSDFHGGGTNSKGTKLIGTVGLGKNTNLQLTAFITKVASGAKKDVGWYQLDFNTAF